MSKKGQHNISGVEAQQWAALSLFLQHLSDPEFERIELEPSELHDFNLVYKDGRKIICESKYYKEGFTYSDLKKILTATAGKKDLGEKDIILIVCRSYREPLAGDVKMIRYFPERYNQKFQDKKFTEQEIALLSRVRFWAASVETNKLACHELLEDYSWFWVPKEDLERFCHSLKVELNDLAKQGATLSRNDLNQKLGAFEKEIVKKTNYYDSEKRNAEDMVAGIKDDLMNNNSPRWGEYNIAALSSQPHLLAMLYGELLKKSGETNLSEWSNLWEPNRSFGFSFKVFGIFSNNLNNHDNRRFILKYISDHIKGLRGFYRSNHFTTEAIRIIGRIVATDKSLLSDAFQTLVLLLTELADDILYVRNDKDLDHKKEQIANLLSEIYKQADSTLQNEIIKYISATFDLIHGHHETPGAVYSVLGKYLISDWNKFRLRFDDLTKLLITQYGRFYEGRLHNGWDHIGSTGSFWGNDYSVSDRKFVEVILKPALSRYYERKPEEAWQFIKRYCITPQKKVSKTRPDFLNRSAIPIVLKRYKSSDNRKSREALAILKEFILSTKGIPVKFELIYQSIRGDDFTDEQKWQLVQVSLIDKYGNLPSTPFVEQIITELGKKNHPSARKALKAWFNNPEYFKKHRIVDNAIPNIETFLDSDLALAITLFKQFISNDAFINKKDEFETYDAAVVLQKILEQDYAKGLAILKTLLRIKRPTINQQILISHGFFHHRDPNDKGDTAVLIRIFTDYVKPHLIKFSNPAYLTHSHSRASFLQFARKLAISDFVSEALVIVKAFMNDPDPYPPGKDPEDPDEKYNEQKRIEAGDEPHTITSVRGHCAWTLASCPSIPSRSYVQEIIGLTKKLLDDPNWYVNHMACFSLNQLARNRLSVMPPEKNILYLDLNQDKAEALKIAKDIEAMAFRFLERISRSTKAIQKALAESALSPFDHIRALNQKDSERLLKIVKNAGIPLQEQFAPFLIYLSEFRASSSTYQNWPWQVPGYYDDLREFDDSLFRKTLEEWTVDGPSEIRAKLAWEYWALVQEAYNDQFEKHFPIALKYLGLASIKYEHGVFENIYRFIDDCIDTQFNECFELWQKCLKTEKAFFDKAFDPYKMHWWPHHYNGRILLLIRERLGDEEFLKWLEILASYPEGSRLEDIGSAAELLVQMPSKYDGIVKKIFHYLINGRKELIYCDLKKAWEHKNAEGPTARL